MFNLPIQLPKLNLGFKSALQSVSPGQVMTFAFNILCVSIVIVAIIALLDVLNEKYKQDKLFGKAKEMKLRKTFLHRMKAFKQYNTNLEILLTEKGREGNLNTIFYGTLIFLVLITVYLISVKQILLAVVTPIVLLKFVNKIVVMLSTNIIEKIEEQLPFAIDNTIRIFSKYGDMRTIIYETSRAVEPPLRNVLERVSRKMISGNTEQVLLEFAEEFDNVWIYSYVFTLLSYVQDANKEDTLNNLKHLRNILEKENTLKKASITDKRYGVVINYAIAGLAGLFGAGNIILNPIGKEFFFGSFTGLICFSGGYGAILLTIMLNIKMSKIKAKK